MDMHRYSGETERLAQAVMRIALDRLRMDAPLDGPRSPADLAARAGQTITAQGLGGNEALRLWTDVLGPATMSVDHPRYLALIPGAPTESSMLFDLAVGASSVRAGGCFVQGGTVGNLSALVAARHAALERCSGERPARWSVAITDETHSSVAY